MTKMERGFIIAMGMLITVFCILLGIYIGVNMGGVIGIISAAMMSGTGIVGVMFIKGIFKTVDSKKES